MTTHEVVENLFRTESGKLASSLARAFGLNKLGVVEDIVQDTLIAALDTWSFRGIPENPTAWLHRVAKNKAIDWIRRRNIQAKEDLDALPGMLAASETLSIEKHFLSWEIEDSQLRMMFACCHPGIPVESQITLVLKTLCGFSVREIANAFLANEAAIEKRLVRVRKYFRDNSIELEVPSREAIAERLDAVLKSLYLLFNEGYKRTDSEGVINRDLCLEALRLALLIAEHPDIHSPEANALVALMTFHAARFDSRINELGEIVLLSEQDRSKWNQELITNGFYYFERSVFDDHQSTYHLEAAIQALHITTPSFEQTNWAAILGLYKRLYALQPTPIVALHMAVSVGKVHGPEAEIELLKAHPLENYYLYHAVLGDALQKLGKSDEAQDSFRKAVSLATNETEKKILEMRMSVAHNDR
ncbi:MAG TPA: sigma-70 family RNA polymerase sigma factor [Candidatus Kapabacteria bacterium]|nr:sigma-70 family RNA polymerase sigma factor [Candidatus Kapabacteria bacterium]